MKKLRLTEWSDLSRVRQLVRAWLGFPELSDAMAVLCLSVWWIRAFPDKKDLAGVEVGTGPGRRSAEEDLWVWRVFMGHKVWPRPRSLRPLPQLSFWWSLSSQTMLTAISMSAIATNGVVPGMWLGLLGGVGAWMVGWRAWVVERRDCTTECYRLWGLPGPKRGNTADRGAGLWCLWGRGGTTLWKGGEGGGWWY